MKIRNLLLIVALLLVFPLQSGAQVGRLLKKIGEEATKGIVDEKKEENKPEVNPSNALMNLLGSSDVKYSDVYDFSTIVLMEMTTFDESGSVESVAEYKTLLNTGNGNSAIIIKPLEGSAESQEISAMTMIFDQVNEVALVLTDAGGNRTAMATPIDDETMYDEEYYVEEEEVEDIESSYQKTGRTKTIAGYRCEEYRFEEEQSTYNVWFTDQVKNRPGKKEMQRAGIPVYYDGPFEGKMMMEMETIEDGKR